MGSMLGSDIVILLHSWDMQFTGNCMPGLYLFEQELLTMAQKQILFIK